MQQELMRAVALLIKARTGRGADPTESLELAHLGAILTRASRAAAGRSPLELEATASGKPQPKDT